MIFPIDDDVGFYVGNFGMRFYDKLLREYIKVDCLQVVDN
jgi:hypothetical protein